VKDILQTLKKIQNVCSLAILEIQKSRELESEVKRLTGEIYKLKNPDAKPLFEPLSKEEIKKLKRAEKFERKAKKGIPETFVKVENKPVYNVKCCILYFDGCSSDNGYSHSRASCGYIINHIGKKWSGGKSLQQGATCNSAEWEGLIEGLKKAKEMGFNEIYIRGDSKHVIIQLTLKYQCLKDHLREYRNQALNLLSGVYFEAKWIPREQNQEADDVANQFLK